MAIGMWLLSLGCWFLSCIFAYACPPEQLLRPCGCRRSFLVCEGIKGQDILDGVFRRLGNSQVVGFILRNSEIEYIPASSVERNAFQKIRIVDSVLSQLFEAVPSSRNRLVQLGLENVTVHSGVDFGYLKPLQKLQFLLIRDTVVPQLGEEFSQSLSQVIRVVDLSSTGTQSIDYAFVGKAKLEDVRVDNASLTNLLRVSFPYPSNTLQRLSFEANQIETLSADQFEYMRKLREVSLAGNKISEISETVFGQVYDQLQYLFLSDNPIKCDCSIKWITLRKSEGKIVTGKCVEPAPLVGKKIVDLKESDFPDCE